MKYYLAGPMTGIPHFNKPAFRRITSKLRSNGLKILSPIETDSEIPSSAKWHQYLQKDLKMLAEADAIIVMPGWANSKGARLEVFIMFELGLPVFEVFEFDKPKYDVAIKLMMKRNDRG